MLRVRDIMTTEVIAVNPDQTIREVMDLFTERHITGAPVVSRGQLVGVISATDLLSFAAAPPGPPVDTGSPYGWSDDGSAPVDEPEELAPAFFTEPANEGDEAGTDMREHEWNALDEFTVADAMTHSPIWQVGPDTSVLAAAETMRQHGIHRILVTEAGSLLGIVTATDIAGAALDHRLVTRTYVFDDRQVPGEEAW
jgi:CBS domain-containing protein